MGDIGDVYLEMPAARTALDVNGIVEIARGVAIDGDDRQMAKIAAAIEFGVALRAAPPLAPPQ